MAVRSFLSLLFSAARKGIIFLTSVLLFFSLSARDLSAEDLDPATALATLLRQNSVLIVGETHRRPESPRLVADIVEAYLNAGGCLTVALEIGSDQQPVLDTAMRGEHSAIRIHPIIDHRAYREMLTKFMDLVQRGRCLRVHAVDAPEQDTGSKDAWMAREIQALIPSSPVLVLVGSLHVLKRIQWESGKDNPYLAERLVRRGIPVLTVLQEWEGDCEKRVGRLLNIRHPRAVEVLGLTLSVTSAYPPEEPEEVVDRVVMWECVQAKK